MIHKTTPISPDKLIDADFTLALNNATGKFFFCKDMLESTPDLTGKIFYWRLAFSTPQKA